MASTMQFTIGVAPDTLQPNQFPLESEKFADNGAWFAQYARWITFNFYNYNIRNVFPDSAYSYNVCSDILENFSYYFGEQRNKIFAYAAQLPSGESVPAPFIAGHQIRNFVDNMLGNITTIVKPIGESISAKNLDYESILDKQVKYTMARMAVKAKPMMDELKARGIEFNPTEKQYSSETEIDEDEESDVDSYEDAAIKIARSIYYEEDLKNQFSTQDALHQLVGGISGTIIEPKFGKVSHTHVPSFNAIYDYRAKDNWGKDALIGGAVILMTPEEIALECGDMTDEELQQLRYMAKSGNSDALLFRSTLNAGWNNITWWGNDGRIAVVKAYWICKRDLLNHRSVNALGQRKHKIYSSNESYQTNDKENVFDKFGNQTYDKRGNPVTKTVHKMGNEIRGEDYTWDVCTTMLIGNMWAKKSGYVDYVVRDKKGFPQLPFQFFSHNLVNGFTKSIVSRLKPLEAEYDRIMLKIREKMGRDYGRVFILNGKKMGISDTIEILRDWKTSGVSVTAGDQTYVNPDNEKLVETIDGTLENIQPYIQMLEILRREMQQTVSISDYALGLQTDTVGKGVQAQSVMNSTIANLPFFDGLVEFYRKKIQYSFELAKQFIKTGHYAVVVSETQVELLNVSKDTLSKDIGIYIVENDPLNEEDKKFLRDYLFNLSQNAQVMQAMGIEPVQVLDLIESYTYKSGKKNFKRAIEYNKSKYMEQQAAQQQAEQQGNAEQEQKIMQMQAIIEKFKEDNNNWRTQQNNETKLLLQQNQNIMDAIQIISDNYPVNPLLAQQQPQEAAQQ